VPHGNFILNGGTMQARYQYGNLTVRKRKKGPGVWQFRWLENGKLKSVLIGTVEKYPKQADAERAIGSLRIKINAQNSQPQFHSLTVGALIDRFMEHYVPKHCRKLTASVYRSLFKKHIRPEWGTVFVENVKALAVKEWLETMPHSQQVKSHVRGLMHILYEVACLWEIVSENPISRVRQSRKRLNKPRVLMPEEFRALLGKLAEPYKTMVVIIACLGLRVSELLGLQWGDIDFENLTVKIQRSCSEGEICQTKNASSEGTLPLDPDLAEVLLRHKAQAVYSAESDFVFTGASGKPPWPDCILADHLKPAAEKAGIGKIGWHTFRRSYATLLHGSGTTLAVQKELLRHADIRTTMNIYTQAVSSAKRDASSKVVDTLWRK
jgi:integrase